MRRRLQGAVVGILVAGVVCAGAARAAEPKVRPALDGVFAAFKSHPLVGLGDAHGLAEEGEFYRRLVRDPRFAAEVGNLVVEMASRAHQDTLDRYVNGEDVPRAELRWVWSDVVGGSITATALMYQQLLAEVRTVNLGLPPARRIKVWAGEPAADWSAIKTPQDLEPYLFRRDASAADVIEREVLGRGRKAVVIYGALHFFPLPATPGLPRDPSLRTQVEREHPRAFYVITPYFGYVQADCSASFEAATRWPPDSLIAPVKGTSLEGLLTRPGCSVIRPPQPAPGAPPIAPEALARLQAGFVRPASGVDADALLYLGPAASLTISPNDPDLKDDATYAAEMARRAPIIGLPPDFANHLPTARRPYRPYGNRP